MSIKLEQKTKKQLIKIIEAQKETIIKLRTEKNRHEHNWNNMIVPTRIAAG